MAKRHPATAMYHALASAWRFARHHGTFRLHRHRPQFEVSAKEYVEQQVGSEW